MVENSKRPRLVGNFIRTRREALGLSQRALGLLFTPPVTTQFISNVERGVTPLPPAHIPVLTKALNVSEAEFMSLMEQEYAYKLSGRLGRMDEIAGANAPAGATAHPQGLGSPTLPIADTDYLFMRNLYDAYQNADASTRAAFSSAAERILNVGKAASAENSTGSGQLPS